MNQASDEFDDFYRRHAPAAFRRARRLLGSEADAHEVVHGVFLSLFERPQQYAGQSRMSIFLYSAVTHACLSRIRNPRTRARVQDQRFATPRGIAGLPPVPENHVLLRSLLLRMPEPLVEVAVYSYMDELTHEEISRVLDCSPRHVGDLLERLSAWARAQELAS